MLLRHLSGVRERPLCAFLSAFADPAKITLPDEEARQRELRADKRQKERDKRALESPFAREPKSTEELMVIKPQANRIPNKNPSDQLVTNAESANPPASEPTPKSHNQQGTDLVYCAASLPGGDSFTFLRVYASAYGYPYGSGREFPARSQKVGVCSKNAPRNILLDCLFPKSNAPRIRKIPPGTAREQRIGEGTLRRILLRVMRHALGT